MEIFTPRPPPKEPADTFTGDVWIYLIHTGSQADRACLSLVQFAPGSRWHWHSYRLGQTLHIIDGTALLGSRDGPSLKPDQATPSTRSRRGTLARRLP